MKSTIAMPFVVASIIVGAIFLQQFQSTRQADLSADSNQISFSHPPGQYNKTIHLDVLTDCPNAKVSVTVDGTVPDFSLGYLSPPIKLDWQQPAVTVVKAKAQCANSSITETIQGSYILGIPHNNPIISLIIDPLHLYDPSFGILAGSNYLERGKAWERETNVTIVDDDATLSFNAGVRIHGNLSRQQAKKSFRIYLRNEYGQKYLNYPLLGTGIKPEIYKRFVLSNGGQDNSGLGDDSWSVRWTLIRTQIVNQLADEIGLPTTHSRPTILFINGKPQGVYIARNYLSSHFYRDKYGYDDVNELRPYLEEEKKGWEELREFLQTHNFAQDTTIELLAEQVNLEQLIDYYILQMYIANVDWPINNYDMFRVTSMVDGSEPDKRWQFMVWDVESSLGGGLVAPHERDFNLFSWLYKNNSQPENHLGDQLIRALFTNESFRQAFLLRMDQLLDTTLSAENVSHHITDQANIIRPDIEAEILLWGNTSIWEQNLEYLYDFIQQRPNDMRLHAEQWLTQIEAAK